VERQKLKDEVRNEVLAQISSRDIIKSAIEKDWEMWTIALNNVFGFGEARINRLYDELNDLYDEYARNGECDWEYADVVRERRVKQIMRRNHATQ
jgi:hypothetical protein